MTIEELITWLKTYYPSKEDGEENWKNGWHSSRCALVFELEQGIDITKSPIQQNTGNSAGQDAIQGEILTRTVPREQ